jgi:succinate dehydrogenase/fumarate reductase flavoprotein subunit
MVFGRIAGATAAQYVKDKAQDGALTLEHAVKYNKEIDEALPDCDRVAPMILPDYTDPRVRNRQLTTQYVGTLR